MVQQCFLNGGRAQVSPPEGRDGRPGRSTKRRRPRRGISLARCSTPVVSIYFWVEIRLAQVLAMLFLLALVSSGLASPVDRYEAENAKLRALLESGGPADIGGSWTPNLTPEVKVSCNNISSVSIISSRL